MNTTDTNLPTTAATPHQPIAIHFRGPFTHRDADFHLRAWGIPFPWDEKSLNSAVHHHAGGYRTFQLPDTADTMKFIHKTIKHPEHNLACPLIARLALFSATPLADAIRLQQWIICHLTIEHEQTLADWRNIATLDVDILHARWPTPAATPQREHTTTELTQLQALLDETTLTIETRRHKQPHAALTHRKKTTT